jgi:dUTP pyrophosphatase
MPNVLKFKKVHTDAVIPSYATSGSAAFDLCAIVDKENTCYAQQMGDSVSVNFAPDIEEFLSVPPKTKCIIRTGLAVAIPYGYEIQIRPRSGLAMKRGITIINSPATVDSDYRGEILVVTYNLGDTDWVVKKGDRFCQGLIKRVEDFQIIGVEEFSEEEMDAGRGGGFGSTGS